MEKRLRLRRAEDFARLRREGQVYRHPFLILSLAPNQLTHNRYGFVTPKRLGNAVNRNRTRRLLREAVRLLHADLQPGYDIVLIARPACMGETFITIQAGVQQTLARARIMVEKDNPTC